VQGVFFVFCFYYYLFFFSRGICYPPRVLEPQDRSYHLSGEDFRFPIVINVYKGNDFLAENRKGPGPVWEKDVASTKSWFSTYAMVQNKKGNHILVSTVDQNTNPGMDFRR
jgi:hypothetical protein